MNKNDYTLEESTANMEYWLSRLQKLPNRSDREWREYFMRNNVWYEDLESLGYFMESSHESVVYKAFSEIEVYKVKRSKHDVYFSKVIENAILHNKLFPETFYSLVGFTDYAEGVRVILKQKFFKGRKPTNEEIKEALINKGFSVSEDFCLSAVKDGLCAKDIHSINAIISDGKLYLIDCNIIKI